MDVVPVKFSGTKEETCERGNMNFCHKMISIVLFSLMGVMKIK